MRRNEVQSVGDVLRLTIQECNMTARLDEQKAIGLWKPVVGDHIARLCGPPTMKLGVMTISVSSPPLRHELTMNRTSIIKCINGKLGKNVISEIRFVG